MNQSRTVSLRTLGCRTNQQEMAVLRTRLEHQGFVVQESDAGADIIVVNTCCVTQTAESKSRRLVQSIEQRYAQAQIMVTGCLAQAKPSMFSTNEKVRWVVGNASKESIPSLLEQKDGSVVHTNFSERPPVDIGAPPSSSIASHLTRLPVKIQEGCDFNCAYCIVPSVRGHSRSAKVADVISMCTTAVEAGFKELIISGTHIGQFSESTKADLEPLLAGILGIDGDFRIRLSSLDPRDLSDGLLRSILSDARICRHLHISMQSLCPEVLKSMNRPFADFDQLCQRLTAARDSCRELSLGTDLVIGFPGETPAQLQQTIETAERIGFTYAHVFPFSSRPGTRAATMKQMVSEKEKQERCAVVSERFDNLNTGFIKSQTGLTHRIITEADNPVNGVTSNFLHVTIPDYRAKRNEWVSVRIESPFKGKKNHCLGIPV